MTTMATLSSGSVPQFHPIRSPCHRLPHFIEKAGRAGVARVFIGLESINPDALLGARKKQNKVAEYRKMLLDWKKAGVTIFAGYIIGFPSDTTEKDLRDIDIIQR